MLRDKVIEIFVKVDDFCKEIAPMLEEKPFEQKPMRIPNHDYYKRQIYNL